MSQPEVPVAFTRWERIDDLVLGVFDGSGSDFGSGSRQVGSDERSDYLPAGGEVGGVAAGWGGRAAASQPYAHPPVPSAPPPRQRGGSATPVAARLPTRNQSQTLFDRLIEARYTRDRLPFLNRINIDLQKLRLLLRLTHDQGVLDPRAFAHACEEIDAVGRMIGGWIRQQQQQAQGARWP